MSIPFLSNLPPVGESVAKLAAEGGQLAADYISVYGFFAFCLVLVLFCLTVPAHMYEKHYKVGDDAPVEPAVELNVNSHQQKSTDPAA
ncbi:hypothetical protein B1A99_09660 [Cohnella sp. CIP 111063]|jgi:hypothetical protein|uniref:hypothetical protein n=1 Tax=unclassified Cohnella TaxID=2636738 RepID=UPI000B8BEF09|nr:MULTISPECIES: hypothetical protein [unclassified Cohnella]OXS59798.1 hypothetical protein B1A99_09660 [Cohnella sp. CIP 111063]PRX72590.1 hypothetical protein B0G52_105143 [Cohnella sp. SGD-V74]